MIKRIFLSCLTAIALSGAPAAAATDASFDMVAARARALAAAPWRKPEVRIPAPLKAIGYDAYRDIRFRPDQALWRRDALPFEAMFFHPGGGFNEPVRIHEIVAGKAREIRYDNSLFHYGKNRFDTRRWRDLGFAGFRLHYPLNTPRYKDELIAFLGASYFRALGADQRYGLSARALAVDTVGGPAGEEFPRFTEFWLERPAREADAVVILALLDSPSLAGAYRFHVQPGKDTVIDVRARLFLRKPVATLGIAPLTSMFLSGENQPPRLGFRPEVHDSDGLSIHTGEGEWIWRPVFNPAQVLATSFQLRNPRGFGLMQRDRAFVSYEDLEARYEKRPSAWVEPLGDWGAGRVELVMIPTPDETHDNVVAYWVPASVPAPLAPLDIAYRLRMQGDEFARPPHGWTLQSRRGAGWAALENGEEQFVVDFTGPALQALAPDAEVRAVIDASPGTRVLEHTVFPNEVTRGWRLALRYRNTDPARPTELRAFLRHQQDTVSETWNAIIPPR